MKTIFCIVTAAIILMTGSLSGIDKSKKDINPDSTAIRIEPDSVYKNQDKTDSKQKFDNFIDNNNNGIDDRAEKNKPAPPKKETADPHKTEPKTP